MYRWVPAFVDLGEKEAAEKKDAGPMSSECAKAPELVLAALTRPQGRKLELASKPPVTFRAEELID